MCMARVNEMRVLPLWNLDRANEMSTSTPYLNLQCHKSLIGNAARVSRPFHPTPLPPLRKGMASKLTPAMHLQLSLHAQH